ncbi:MAG: hypothetical protein ACT6FG_00190 [Methanosarcinaceae archaeon]
MDEDVVKITVDMLDSNWDNNNILKPGIIAPIEDHKRLDLGNKDAIVVYDTGPAMRERGDIFYETEDFNSFVSIDIRTVLNKTRLEALWTEVNRIRILKRKAPHADWQTIYQISRTPRIDKSVGLWRYIVEWRYLARKVLL